MLIRPARPEDAEERAALTAVCYPHALVDAAALRDEKPPPELCQLSLVAEENGRIVASGSLSLSDHGPITALQVISVAPGARRKGVGTAMHEALDAHRATLPATRVRARVTTSEGRSFAEAKGFTPGSRWLISAVDPREVPPVPRIPAGVTLSTLADIAEYEPVFELYRAAGADMPGRGDGPGFTFESWLKFAVNGSVSDRDCSIVAFEGSEPVALTFLNTCAGRGFNSLAGTRADRRGRGLATLVKTVSLHKAAAKGVALVYTANSDANAPMLAVNTRLGYVPALEEISMGRSVAKSE
ncbi:GNAT family N-acetyltransferase [Phytomonospora sp. NPDC050363]|uniref:GNAT family N-acetyltransferase n=1 Tax=Phytomonospora sp. NPDC050363 TaxID=3155642 RepID=UPI0033DF7B6D